MLKNILTRYFNNDQSNMKGTINMVIIIVDPSEKTILMKLKFWNKNLIRIIGDDPNQYLKR